VGFDPTLVPRDSRNIIRGARLSANDEHLAAEMTTHVRLQALVEAPSSSVLFVEGASGQHAGRGPVSVATARVAGALARGREGNAALYALAYFCSEHKSPRQEFGTAVELVITLLLQLVEQHGEFDESLLARCRDAVLELPEEVAAGDVRGFCELLGECVTALPREATLFCVIEGVGFFERPMKRTEHMQIVIEYLLGLGRADVDGRARVKCLFTTPARSPEFSSLFESYEVLVLRIVNSSGFFRRNSWIIGRTG
jgi:hypothetical protein